MVPTNNKMVVMDKIPVEASIFLASTPLKIRNNKATIKNSIPTMAAGASSLKLELNNPDSPKPIPKIPNTAMAVLTFAKRLLMRLASGSDC